MNPTTGRRHNAPIDRLDQRPLRVLLHRAGTFAFHVHVRDLDEAARAVTNFQAAQGLTPEDVTGNHGLVIRAIDPGRYYAAVAFDGTVTR